MSTVSLHNVSKTYKGGIEAVLDATLDIRDGEFIVLVGPSGCGKSTLLRMIAGLEEVSEGDIFIGQRRVNEVSPRDRNVAMVFQNYALYPHMSVAQNLGFGLKLRKFSKAEIQERVRAAAEILGIEDILARKPSDLSGGQRQRVAVGRAIVRQPDVFLFDEPLSNLDARLRVQMRMEITRLHRQLGTTMVYVTHDQIEAMTMGDRIVVLDKGVIQQVESPLSLYNSPANQFVASFIGSPGMNLFPGKLRLDDALVFDAEDSALSCSLSNRRFDWLKPHAERHIQLGIRPEHIRQSEPMGPEFGTIRADFRLDIVEPMGNEVVIYARRHDDSVVARFAPESLPNPGYELSLRMDVSEAHFFDAESGVNLKRIRED